MNATNRMLPGYLDPATLRWVADRLMKIPDDGLIGWDVHLGELIKIASRLRAAATRLERRARG